jgi:hypothetical protein
MNEPVRRGAAELHFARYLVAEDFQRFNLLGVEGCAEFDR